MSATSEQQIYDFLVDLFGDNEGVVYAPTKGESAKSFIRYYFNWPSQKNEVVRHMQDANAQKKDVWVAPALLKSNVNAKKTNWLGTQYLYVDFDEGVPQSLPEGIPEPTLKIQSSIPGREHWYWKLEKFYTGDENRDMLEALNKSLTYALGGDTGGWDATQVLRAPGTKHRAKGVVTRVLKRESEQAYSVGAFKNVLPAPPKAILLKQQEKSLPDIIEVLSRVTLKKDALEIFNRKKEEMKPIGPGDRSAALFKFASDCLEVRPPIFKSDILSMLNHLAYKWGKFDNRSDRFEQVKKVLENAIVKHDPKKIDADLEEEQFSDLEFLTLPQMLERQTVTFEWIYEKHIAKGTFNVLASLGGIGKTSLAMQLGMHMASGTPFLETRPALERPVKNVMFSFEMPEQVFNQYAVNIASNFSSAEQELISKNWLRSGLGYKVSLWDPAVQDYMMQQIAKHNPEVIFIDSVKYAGGMDEKKADELYTWIKRDILAKLNISVVFIHHLRKSTSENANKEPMSIDDLYGDAYIGNIADSLTFLWKPTVAGAENLIKFRQVKARTHSLLEPMFLQRTSKQYYMLNESDSMPTISGKTGDEDAMGMFGGRQ